MDLDLSPDQTALRDEVRAWARANFTDEFRAGGGESSRRWQAKLAGGGWGAPTWPVEHGGRGAGPIEAHIIATELARAGAPQPISVIGIGWAGPAIIGHGTEVQKRRLLAPMLRGDQIWCQLFSEPDAGSDLAALRTRAELNGGRWVINGQKIWSSYARESDFGILLARTDPDARKHEGITCFAFPMHQLGVEVRPIRQMDGKATFNEVFFTNAQVPVENVIGPVNEGWAVAVTTLMSERVGLSMGAGSLWGSGPTLDDLLALARRSRPDAMQRQRLAALYAQAEAIRLTGYRMLSNAAKRGRPGVEVSVSKLAADRWGQELQELAMDLQGMGGLVTDTESIWPASFLFAPALTIGGGTTEVQLNILAQRVLGLPRERG